MSIEAMKMALEAAEGIANADWRKWEELASPEEFVRWAKSRAAHIAITLRTAIEQAEKPVEIDGNTSDGYHTFNELYEFRKAYNAALFNEWAAGGKCSVHKSWRHHNGELCFGGGWFIVVAVLPQGQISNHYEAKDWNLFDVPETERALFEFDGHTGSDVVARLKAYTASPTVPRQEQYDQTSLELCEECGWKAMIPGDGCLVCARQKAKPVAYVDERIHGWPDCFVMEPDPPHTVPLYTAPRQWVELTDDEARALVNRATFGDRTNWQALVYMVDAKLKEKNHG